MRPTSFFARIITWLVGSFMMVWSSMVFKALRAFTSSTPRSRSMRTKAAKISAVAPASSTAR